MATVIKSTLRLAQKLQEAGISPNQAQGIVEALDQELTHDELATKADLSNLKADILKWVATMMIAQTGALAALLFGMLQYFQR